MRASWLKMLMIRLSLWIPAGILMAVFLCGVDFGLSDPLGVLPRLHVVFFSLRNNRFWTLLLTFTLHAWLPSSLPWPVPAQLSHSFCLPSFPSLQCLTFQSPTVSPPFSPIPLSRVRTPPPRPRALRISVALSPAPPSIPLSPVRPLASLKQVLAYDNVESWTGPITAWLMAAPIRLLIMGADRADTAVQ